MAETHITQKSTIDRLRPLPFPRWVRSGVSLASGIAPRATAHMVRRLFFTPPPSRVRPEQTQVLARGRRFDVRTSHGRAAGWVWGEGEPVLLIHGWGGQAGQLTPFVEPLLAAGLRPIAIDVPGHGSADRGESSIFHFASAIDAVGDLFGPSAGVVAHSFGAAASTLALSRGARTARVVFIAPPASFDTFVGRMRHALGFSSGVERRFRELAEERLSIRFELFEPLYFAPRIDVPLLILHDPADDEVPFEGGEELARHWRGARLEALSGLGHYRPLRDPKTIARTVRFLVAGT